MSRHASVVLGAISLMGCIIPLAPDYQVPPDTRSVVRGVGRTPSDEIIRINRDTAPSQITFEVEIVDPDIAQDLAGYAYVNFDDASGRPFPANNAEVRIEAPTDSPDPTRRTVMFMLDQTDFDIVVMGAPNRLTGCRVLEFRVNGDYDGFPPVPVDSLRQEIPSEDEAVGTWLVALTNEDQPVVDVTECPSVMVGE